MATANYGCKQTWQCPDECGRCLRDYLKALKHDATLHLFHVGEAFCLMGERCLVSRGRGVWFRGGEAFCFTGERCFVSWGRGVLFHGGEVFCFMGERCFVSWGRGVLFHEGEVFCFMGEKCFVSWGRGVLFHGGEVFCFMGKHVLFHGEEVFCFMERGVLFNGKKCWQLCLFSDDISVRVLTSDACVLWYVMVTAWTRKCLQVNVSESFS